MVLTLVIAPLLFVALAGVLQLGALRVAVARVRAAADLAALVAVNDQDDAELAKSGSLRPRRRHRAIRSTRWSRDSRACCS